MSSSALKVGAPTLIVGRAGLGDALSGVEKGPQLQRLPPAPGKQLHTQCYRKGSSAVVSQNKDSSTGVREEGRRRVLLALAAAAAAIAAQNERANADEGNRKFTDMPAIRGKDYGKSAMRAGPDYVLTDSGLQYKELKPGNGPEAQQGQTAVIDWDGYTIGYYGRIFEARNKAKGGSFEGSEKDFYRFRLGDNKVIPAFEEAVKGMRVGSIRRIIVPPELGYPNNDFSKAGPQPQTFSGQRALDFVLKNQGLIDKTLLFDIELLKLED